MSLSADDKFNLNNIAENESMKKNNNYIIKNTAGNLYWKNVHSVYLGCNYNMAKVFKLKTPEEVVGKTDYNFYLDEDYVKKIIENDQLVIKLGKELLFEEIGTNEEGKLATFLTKKIPLRDEKNNIVGVMGTSIDITKQKQAELAKAELVKSDFISNMEHDLRTPLSGIGGIANLLYAQYKDKYPELSPWLELMIKSCSQWEKIHNRIFDVLAVEQLEPVKIETVSISKELMEIQEMMAATLSLKQLAWVLEPIPEHLDRINTDPLKFRLILSSLISNAINFTEKGEIRLTITEKKGACLIKVADTGIGIPADQFEYIFEKFTKLSRSNKYGSHFKGIGLGLYTAKQCANHLGATIHVESQLGKGSIFSVKLPL